MEDSYKEVHENMPTYGQGETGGYPYAGIKQVQSGNILVGGGQQEGRYTSYKTTFTEESGRPQAARNEILKELRQEYEILRNLNI